MGLMPQWEFGESEDNEKVLKILQTTCSSVSCSRWQSVLRLGTPCQWEVWKCLAGSHLLSLPNSELRLWPSTQKKWKTLNSFMPEFKNCLMKKYSLWLPYLLWKVEDKKKSAMIYTKHKTKKQGHVQISFISGYDILGYNTPNYLFQNNKNIAISDTVRDHFKTLSKRSV